MKLLSIFVFLFISIFCSGEVERANSEEGILRFEYRIINRSSKTENIKFYFTIPVNNERQEILTVYPEPGFKNIQIDKYGNKIVTYVENNMLPGEVRTHGWIAHVKMYAAVYKKSIKKETLSKKERKLYLMDKENYRINDKIITKIKNKIVKNGDTPYDIAFSIYKYLIKSIVYYRDDKWEPAPDVLKSMKGSCSEFNYTFIALLRASGIPARYTGAFTIKPANTTKYDEFTQEDAVFHRWTEVFTPTYGWIPFDASRGSGSIKRSSNYLDFVGRIPAGALQTYRGDGGKNNLLRWDYIANGMSGSRSDIRDIPVGYYISLKKHKGSLKQSIERVKRALKQKLTQKTIAGLLENPIDRETFFMYKNHIDKRLYPALIKELIRINHPEAIYYSLYSSHINKEIPYLLNYAVFTNDALKKNISKILSTDKWDWQLFEYWWRKARPHIKFNKKLNLFVLTKKNINIY